MAHTTVYAINIIDSSVQTSWQFHNIPHQDKTRGEENHDVKCSTDKPIYIISNSVPPVRAMSNTMTI